MTTDRRDPMVSERVRLVMRRTVIALATTLSTGVVWTIIAPTSLIARRLLIGALALLIVFPLANVVLAVVAEGRKREWSFAAAAIASLAILLYQFGVAVVRWL